jgi:hypothetical protein
MPSPIDILYRNLYGSLPKKEGAAYERLAAAVCKLLAPHCEVFHDTRIRGEFSKSFHQLDVQRTDGGETSFGEAKDYTADQRKVGRGDIQKLGGALGDLPVSKAIFFSATDYTKPALQYAAAAAKIVGKPIEPFHLRPAVDQDRDGRVETIRIQIHIEMPEVAFGVELTDADRAKLVALGRGAFQQAVDRLLDANGNVMKTIPELLPPECWKALYAGPPEGFIPLSGAFIRVDDQLIGIQGMTYKVTHKVTTHEVVIQPNGEATLLIKSVDGTLDKLITDTDLKKVTFNDYNEAVIR